MVYVILVVLLLICARGWLTRYISCAILAWYIQEQNMPFPSNEDMKRGGTYVTENIIKDLVSHIPQGRAK